MTAADIDTVNPSLSFLQLDLPLAQEPHRRFDLVSNCSEMKTAASGRRNYVLGVGGCIRQHSKRFLSELAHLGFMSSFYICSRAWNDLSSSNDRADFLSLFVCLIKPFCLSLWVTLHSNKCYLASVSNLQKRKKYCALVMAKTSRSPITGWMPGNYGLQELSWSSVPWATAILGGTLASGASRQEFSLESGQLTVCYILMMSSSKCQPILFEHLTQLSSYCRKPG